MKSSAICPISNQKINETVARINGGLTVLILLAFAISTNFILISFLVFDFLMRSTDNSRFSILSLVSRKIAELLALKPRHINAGPKIFAARIGLLFSFLVLVLSLFGFSTAATFLLIVFGICAFLEAAFAICIACEIYPYVYRFLYKKIS